MNGVFHGFLRGFGIRHFVYRLKSFGIVFFDRSSGHLFDTDNQKTGRKYRSIVCIDNVPQP